MIVSLFAPALLLIAALAAPAPPADPAARVRALGERYREHLLERRPDLAVRWRVQGARHALAPITEATLARDAAWLASLRAEVEAVPAAALDPASASLLRMLAGRLAEEEAQSGAGGILHRDPFAWVRLLRDLAADAADADRRSPCQRAQALAPVLERAPELWRSASIVMRGPAPAEGLRDSLHAARQWLRDELPARVLDCRDPLVLGAFVRADSQAVYALGVYGAFVLGDSAFATPRIGERRSERGAVGR